MPVIKIRENEEVNFTAFDATENVVLIPLLYARDYTIDKETGSYTYDQIEVPSEKFVSYKTFTEKMGLHQFTVDGSRDKSYIMAYELLLQGLSVVIKPITFDNAANDEWHINESGDIVYDKQNELTLEEAYVILNTAIGGDSEKGIPSVLDEFKDRNIYNLKFLTTGGYTNCGWLYNYVEDPEDPEYIPEGERKITIIDGHGHEQEISTYMGTYKVIQSLAEERGDAIALVEYRQIFDSKDQLLKEIDATKSSFYAAAFYPWCICNVTSGRNTTQTEMPASFCYLQAYANSVSFSANWFAAAGVTRGRVPNMVKPLAEVGESLMHILQNDSAVKEVEEGTRLNNVLVNPIFNAGTYGYRIWGNRVYNASVQDLYMNFLNVRVLLCDIKKQIYHAAMRVTFEPNDDIVWINFKTLANTPLERMKSGRGISWYKWTRDYDTNKATIKATLTIKPIEAVESFDINVVLTDDEVTVEDAI